MLMLTHTWILKEFLGKSLFGTDERTCFTYNVAPDLLTFHRAITSEMTHQAERLLPLPEPYRKAAFIQFHLLVDDIAHYGHICDKPVQIFNPDSRGYTYVKGRPLVQPLLDLQNRSGHPITRPEAAYQSHILIEMAFDLVLHQRHGFPGLLPLFSGSLTDTVGQELETFGKTMEWMTGIPEDTAREALVHGAGMCTPERMQAFMNTEGRINLFIDKFGLDRNNLEVKRRAVQLMEQGMELVRDVDAFVSPTIETIRDSAFVCSL
jgi:hypothetical protein